MEDMDWPDHFVKLGGSSVYYTEPDNLRKYQDVFIKSESGGTYGFNRSHLSSLSSICHDIFLDLYQCPLANSDEAIHISTNMSSKELDILSQFFYHGNLPTLPSNGGINLEAIAMFEAFAMNLEDYSYLKEEDNLNPLALNDGLEPPGCTTFDDDPEDHPIRRKRARKPHKNDHIQIQTSTKQRQGATHVAAKRTKADLFSFPQEGPRDLQLAYQCQRCVRGFSKVSDYRQHFRRHNMEKEDMSKAYICLRCMDFEASQESLIVKHCKSECPVKRHDDNESQFTYFCAFCEAVFETSNMLEKHLGSMHPNEQKLLSRSSSQCQACGKEFRDSSALKKHMNTEGPKHKCRCMECKKNFGCWADLSNHIVKVHDNKIKYWCGFCGVNYFDTQEAQKQHKQFCKLHVAVGPVKSCSKNKVICTICGMEVGVSHHDWKNHLKEYHSELGLPCTLCDDMFFDEKNLQEHYAKIHVNNSKYSCDMCEKSYPSRANLKLHKETQHPIAGKIKRAFKCDLCDATLTTKGGLKIHKERIHSDSPPIVKTRVCEVCGKKVRAGWLYAEHLARKHGNAKIPCKVCGKTFATERHLKEHNFNVHLTVTCEVCGMECQNGQYKRHMMTKHASEDKKPFYCSLCQKGFVDRPNYQTHMYTHTGEKPHKCKFCDRCFADTSNRRKHMKHAHPDLLQKEEKSTEI